MRIGRIVFGILGAIGAGAILGVLFAPDKGSVTRAKLTRKTNEFGEDLNAKFTDVVETVNKKMEVLKEEANKMAVELKKKAENARFENTEKARMN